MSLNTDDRPIAKEGGWGYLVMLGFIFCFMSSFGLMNCLGLLFGDFLRELGHQTKALTLLPSCFYIAFSVVGVLNKYLFRKYGARCVGVFGAIIFCTGSILIIFVRTLNQLLIAYGFLQGLGFGMMISVSYTTFNQYFVKNRLLVMGLAQAILGFGFMGLPILVEFLLNRYGFRGCMAILAAFNLHVIFGMLVMHPVEWHVKQGYSKGNKSESIAEAEAFLEKKHTIIPEKHNLNCWSKIVDFLDLSLLFDPTYANICIGMALSLYSDVAFFTIQPSYLRELYFDKSDIALIVAIGAGTDLIARVFLCATTKYVSLSARFIFLIGVNFTILSRIAFQFVSSFVGVALVTGAMGFCRAWIHLPIGVVFADYLPAARFPSGYGLFMLVQGIVMFTMGPLIGWIRDHTHSYPITFNLLTVAMLACAVPWTIEMYWRQRKQHTKSTTKSGTVQREYNRRFFWGLVRERLTNIHKYTRKGLGSHM